MRAMTPRSQQLLDFTQNPISTLKLPGDAGPGLRPGLFLELGAGISGSPKGKRGIDPGKGSVTYAKCSDPKLPVSTHKQGLF